MGVRDAGKGQRGRKTRRGRGRATEVGTGAPTGGGACAGGGAGGKPALGVAEMTGWAGGTGDALLHAFPELGGLKMAAAAALGTRSRGRRRGEEGL